MPNPHIWCVIPVYNNKNTVKDVALGCRKLLENIIVVDDGSTDADLQSIFAGTDIRLLKHPRNLGKGQAIRTALDFIHQQSGTFMLTIDADGQHFPEDINKFIPLLDGEQDAIIIGCRNFQQESIPEKSQFGRAFSNFWLRIETGVALNDTQSGFRSYPVKYLSKIKTRGNHYDFETEILTRASWSGLKIKEVPIQVFYPPKNLRISSFRPFLDNLRISLMHIRLIGRRLMPFPYPKLIRLPKTRPPVNFILHPVKLIKILLKENATPLGLGVSAGVGVFLGVLPLVSIHMIATLYVTSRLHLNKIMALSIQNICMPPFVPIACIELGHFMLYGEWFTQVSWQNTMGALPHLIWRWFLGSLILAPLMGILSGIIIYFSAQAIQKRMHKDAK
jgi:glycosyltransferase involved in cell wall biosynthesis